MVNQDILARIEDTLLARKGAPAAESYVASLYAKGLDAILKKGGRGKRGNHHRRQVR